MNTNENKHIEELVDKVMRNQTLETPSFDFTSKVMNQLAENKKSQAFIYKPLISKQASFVIFSISAIIICLTLLHDSSNPTSRIIPIDLSFLYERNLSKIFSFSKIATYSITLAAIMLFGQITFLRNYFNQKN